MSYEFSKKSYEIGKAAYQKVISEMTVKAGSSGSFIRQLIIGAYKMLSRENDAVEQECRDNISQYSMAIANEKNAALRNAQKEKANALKELLSARVHNWEEAKNEQVKKYVMTPSTEKQNGLMRDYEIIGAKNVMPKEWEWLDAEMAPNYLASKRLKQFAEKADKVIILPMNIDETLDRIHTFAIGAERAVAHLDNMSEDVIGMSFVTDTPDAPILKLIEDIDNDTATIIPTEKLTVVKRLKDAMQNAYDKDDIGLNVRIQRFLEKNLNELSTPEELRDELYQKAEELIAEGMAAHK